MPRLPYVLAWTLLAHACSPLERDVSLRDGGTSPDPSATFYGTIRYRGPPPLCEDRNDGTRAVRGVFVAFLYRAGDPPAPFGHGAAVATWTIDAAQLFAVEDCGAEPSAILERAAPLVWAEIPLAENADRFQIRALFDHNGNFLPQFRIRAHSDAGDTIGGALEADGRSLRSIEVPARSDAPNGMRIVGVDVSLAARVQTEPPMFRYSGDALRSDHVLPTPVTEEALLPLTRAHLHTLQADEVDTGEWIAEAWNAADIAPTPNAPRGFYFAPVDGNGDGAEDPHLLLPNATSQAPLVRFVRAKTPAERAAGLPDVEIFASARPETQTLARLNVELVIAPIATLRAARAPDRCAIRITPPGANAEVYEANTSDCQILPSGNYDIWVWNGLIGAALVPESNTAISNTGFVFDRSRNFFSPQSWAIPNELGCPDTRYDPSAQNQLDRDPSAACPSGPENEVSLQLPMQGRAGGFSVVDGNAAAFPNARDTSDGHGVETCQMAPSASGLRAVVYPRIAEDCCEPYRRFCGLPLCHGRDLAVRADRDGNRTIREAVAPEQDYRNDGGEIELLCVPFAMPAICCR